MWLRHDNAASDVHVQGVMRAKKKGMKALSTGRFPLVSVSTINRILDGKEKDPSMQRSTVLYLLLKRNLSL